MLPSVIRVCCASLFLLFETLELRLALLAAYTQIAWQLFVCLCRGLFSSLSFSLSTCLSLSSILLLSPIQSVRRPPPRPRDMRRVASAIHRVMLPCQQPVHVVFFVVFLVLRRPVVEVCLTEEKTVGNGRGGGAGACQNTTNQPKARSDWGPLPLGKLLVLLRLFCFSPPW